MESLQFVFDKNLLSLSSHAIQALSPFIAIVFVIFLTLVFAVIRPLSKSSVLVAISSLGLVFALMCSLMPLPNGSVSLFNGMLLIDGFSSFYTSLFMICGIATIFLSKFYLDGEALQYPEYYILVLMSLLGMMLMVSSSDLIVFFISLEVMSLALYGLVGFRRSDRRSNEAALKYFVMGSAASAVLLYGCSLVYGATGALNYGQIGAALTANPNASPPLVIGFWMILSGFLFKVGAVPFHLWVPDVYEGAPTPVTGLMSTGVKAASFGAFLRVFLIFQQSAQASPYILKLIFVCAVATMIVGNIIALTQTQVKRMLAYSAVAHSGYLLMGILAVSRSPETVGAINFYLFGYSIMSLGAFGVLSLLGRKGDTGLNLQDLAGLSSRHPYLAFTLAVFMFSMAGIPPTVGFAGKYYLFYSTVKSGYVGITIIAAICSVISVYYYLRILVYMYMKDSTSDDGRTRKLRPVLSAAILLAAAIATIGIGLIPSRWLSGATKAEIAKSL